MTDTPNVGAPEWASAQALPWVQHNKALRIFDAFAVVAIVEEMDRNDPPATCDDGARYHLGSSPTGQWLTDGATPGLMAIALGDNAANGWAYAIVETVGVQLFNRADGIRWEWSGVAWVSAGSVGAGGASIGDLSDVDLAGIADGYVLKYDLSNGNFYPAPDLDSDTDTGITRIQDALDFGSSGAGLIDGYVLVWDESNQLFYLAPSSGLTLAELKATAAFQVLAAGATIDWDMSAGYNAKVTLAGAANAIQTPTNPHEGLTYTLLLVQDGTGSRTVTWPASISFGSAGAPTLSTGAGKKDLISLQCIDASAPEFRASFNKAA